MSTLPFLLSVADELDNINSQSYMDDFGLGFHPHRQFYRTPTIQLSLPASTDWMQQERQQRYRVHKFVDETQNDLEESTATVGDDGEHDNDDANDDQQQDDYTAMHQGSRYSRRNNSGRDASAAAAGTSSCNSRQKYTSAFAVSEPERSGRTKGKDRRTNNIADDSDNIDNSVQMYNLSKKCCKNYYRQTGKNKSLDAAASTSGVGVGTAGGGGAGTGTGTGTGTNGIGGFRLHSKCLEGNNSSSDESLQKVSSSIEFLTCFLLKKSRAPSSSTSSASGQPQAAAAAAAATTTGGSHEGGGKKS